jgi:hypothetical protein
MEVTDTSVERSEHLSVQANYQTKETTKLPLTPPLLRSLGSLFQQTGDGGSSSEYDSYDKHRAS